MQQMSEPGRAIEILPAPHSEAVSSALVTVLRNAGAVGSEAGWLVVDAVTRALEDVMAGEGPAARPLVRPKEA